MVKETKSSLFSITYILTIINVCQKTRLNKEKPVTVGPLLWVNCVQHSISLRNVWIAGHGRHSCSWKVQLVNFSQAMYTQVFFSSVKPTTLIMLLQVTKYSMHGACLAAQPNITNLYSFQLICANVGVLFSLEIQLLQACKKHLYTWFPLKQFQFWSITQSEMLCHVSVECYLK